MAGPDGVNGNPPLLDNRYTVTPGVEDQVAPRSLMEAVPETDGDAPPVTTTPELPPASTTPGTAETGVPAGLEPPRNATQEQSAAAAENRPVVPREVAAQIAEVEAAVVELYPVMHRRYAPSLYKAEFGPSPGNPNHPTFETVDEWLDFVTTQALEEVRDEGPLSDTELEGVARRAIREVWAAARDYHVDGTFQATEIARLGFRLRGGVNQDGEMAFAVGAIGSTNPLAAQLPVGTEILAIDGVPLADAVGELVAGGDPDLINKIETDMDFAELFFTVRVAALGEEIPEAESAVLTVRDAAGGEEREVVVPWAVTGRPQTDPAAPAASDVPVAMTRGEIAQDVIARMGTFAPMADSRIALEAGSREADVHRCAEHVDLDIKSYANQFPPGIQNLAQLLASRPEFSIRSPRADVMPLDPNVNPYSLGGRTSYVPRLGATVEEAESTESDLFEWYVFDDDEGTRSAYFRLPTYSPSLPPGDDRDPFEVHVDQISKVFALFNELEVENLYFDQVQNPGGAVPYANAVLSHLITEPLETARHAVIVDDERRASNEQTLALIAQLSADAEAQIREAEPDAPDDVVADAVAVALLGETFAGYPVNAQFLRDFTDSFILENESAARGEGDLSEPVHISGVRTIQPAPDAFQGDIFFMFDATSISAGDFVPAQLREASFQEVPEGGDISDRRIRFISASPGGSSGAGGFVRTFDPAAEGLSNPFGIDSFRLTGSLAILDPDSRDVRAARYIEGLGVQGDVEIVPTFEDIAGGHVDFGNRILDFAQDPDALSAADDAAGEQVRAELTTEGQALSAMTEALNLRAVELASRHAEMIRNDVSLSRLFERVDGLPGMIDAADEQITGVAMALAGESPAYRDLSTTLEAARAEFARADAEIRALNAELDATVVRSLATDLRMETPELATVRDLANAAVELNGQPFALAAVYNRVSDALGPVRGDEFLIALSEAMEADEAASVFDRVDNRAAIMAGQVADPERFRAVAVQLATGERSTMTRFIRALNMADLDRDQRVALLESDAFNILPQSVWSRFVSAIGNVE